MLKWTKHKFQRNHHLFPHNRLPFKFFISESRSHFIAIVWASIVVTAIFLLCLWWYTPQIVVYYCSWYRLLIQHQMSISYWFSDSNGWTTEKPLRHNLSDGRQSKEGNANSFKSTAGLLSVRLIDRLVWTRSKERSANSFSDCCTLTVSSRIVRRPSSTFLSLIGQSNIDLGC